jgi:hypothetical protein
MSEANTEKGCNPHPNAPHGFLRQASHAANRYVCECEWWNEKDYQLSTLEEAEEVANAVSLIPTMIADFTYISLHLGDLEGERELTHSEKAVLDRANQMLAKLKPVTK